MSEAAEDSELPAGADLGAWVAALERRRADIRQEAWIVPIGLVVVVALTFLNGASGDRAVAGLVFLAVFVTWGMSNIVSRSRRRDGVDASSSRCRSRCARTTPEVPSGRRPPPTTGSPGCWMMCSARDDPAPDRSGERA
ncbi:hypothetical protein BC477_12020 [Clavibacter michiganensis subsp. michiganensis]|uniref:Uncharacterized protein n=1 Tax=Clavibacter michiganensis subsp. michiganensis TaxID=33013 RepID=A0A251XIB6_CLAMM|nr:hypothetical protein BC477_12020 [Clavibacter michiganensis subsp. michiganensis]OUE02522.1 hypothetical protein CMMCAS07_10930 [Clavibacter michiganensis subsp. michiganensis]